MDKKMNSVNEIMLRRKNKVIVSYFTPDSVSKSAQSYAADTKKFIIAMVKNFEGLGYTLSADLINALVYENVDKLKVFYKSTIKTLKELVGANYAYNPMYPQFPTQVIEATDFELLFNALVHYATCGEYLPNYDKDERLPLTDNVKLKVINLGTMKDFEEIFQNLMSAKSSLSEMDKEDLNYYFANIGVNRMVFPQEIPLKENLAYISKLVIEANSIGYVYISKYYKTATDVLRFAVALSEGDISLATNTRFITFSRPIRKALLSLLESCGNIEEDMKRYKGQWIRLGEKLHPNEFKNRYPKAIAAFTKIRQNEHIDTFAGKLNAAINSGELNKVLSLLVTRPGEFARNLDYVLRLTERQMDVVKTFEKVAPEVATPVLLQVYNHFYYRSNTSGDTTRIFFPKGQLAKVYVKNESMVGIDQKIINAIVVVCERAIISQYRSRSPLGKVYIAPELQGYVVPFSQRSASKGMRIVTRGSRFTIKDDANVIRAFIHWHNTNGQPSRAFYDGNRVDIDLSAVLYDENWKYLSHISYTRLYSMSSYKACHSGDIVDAPDGACEFIDFDISSFTKENVGRYIGFEVRSFTGQKFTEVPECFFGWMERENMDSGEVFEPTTVINRIDLTADSSAAIPMVFDIKNRQMIWCDMSGSANVRYGGNNVESNLRGSSAVCKALAEGHKPTMMQVAMLNAFARGEMSNNEDIDPVDSIFVDDPQKADTVFALEIGQPERIIGFDEDNNPIKSPIRYITPFDVDIWLADLI